ncbi:MAG TPA: hypothetical protein VGL75_18230 [Acidothermaceae bacterium]
MLDPEPLEPELPELEPELFAFGVALGFESLLGFAEPPESPDLLSAAGLLAELPESAEPESDPELEPEPESDDADAGNADPPASDRLFESARLSVR